MRQQFALILVLSCLVAPALAGDKEQLFVATPFAGGFTAVASMANTDPVRFAYVGCGFVAQNIHIPNFAAQPNCQFVAVAEARKELGERVAKRYGVQKVYRSHEEIAADPEIEAVGVSAPYVLQGRIAEDLIKAGKHVFMEKPMAVSIERGQSIFRFYIFTSFASLQGVDRFRARGNETRIALDRECPALHRERIWIR